MPEFYTWAILLINQLGEIGEKQLSIFGSRGGGANLPLNARTPLNIHEQNTFHVHLIMKKYNLKASAKSNSDE